ncbi:hypothetical protein JCM8547_001314 [Rhodosporidiobolus lusitaniae]
MLLRLASCTLFASYCSAAALQFPFARPAEPAPLPLPLPQQQPGSSDPQDWPYRELPWGDVNVVSTTDTHGWLLGHQRNEPSFSGDWGDLYSFVQRLKEEARRRGVDLLLVDSGDRVDGNGLVDAEPPEHPKGYAALNIFSSMPYDLVTTGNHELYKDPVASYVSSTLSRNFGPKWVVSNVNLTDPVTGQKTKLMGNRFRKFETEQGRRVTAFGPLFEFKGSLSSTFAMRRSEFLTTTEPAAHGKNISVQSPHLMVKEPWFLEAIADKPDFFLFAGHMSIRIEPDSQWSLIVRTIRGLHPRTPVLVFGGHHHIRDCVQEDEYSMSLAAGRYMETIGWMSVSNLNDLSEPPTFRRRYLDQNRNTYAYHTSPHFDTSVGLSITHRLTETAARFNLTEQFGTAPQDYYLHRYPVSHKSSVMNLLTEEVLPLLIRREDREVKPWTVLNTGSVRFDLFKGPFTKGDQWIMLPFTNDFLFIPFVPLTVAAKVLHYLNVVGEHGMLPSQNPDGEEYIAFLQSVPSASAFSEAGENAEGKVGTLHASASSAALELSSRRRLSQTFLSSSAPSSSPPSFSSPADTITTEGGRWRTLPRSEGYVTLDSCGSSNPSEQLGDDTLHRPFRTARQPTFVATALQKEEEVVDVVFFDFITPDVLGALRVLDKSGRKYEVGDVRRYVDISANTLMETYAKRAWN